MKTKLSEEYEKAANLVRETAAYKEERVKADFTESIWNRLEELHLSQAEFARRLNVTPARVTKILDGSTNFTFRTAAAISSALDMDFEAALVPKANGASIHGRIAISLEEGVFQAKINSSWRNAELAPKYAMPTTGKERFDHEYTSASVG